MTTQIERSVHNGRGLVTHDVGEGSEFADNDRGQVMGWPEVAYEAIRSINHVTGAHAIPAPVVYDVLGELKGVGHLLPQALDQIGSGLKRSLDEFDVYDNSDRTPAETVEQARVALAQAAEYAQMLGTALEAAQSILSDQGYRQQSGAQYPIFRQRTVSVRSARRTLGH